MFFVCFFFNVKIKIVLKDYDKSNKQAKTLSFLIQEKCIAIMEDLEALPVNLIILKKNPDIMNTIKKVCISIGVCALPVNRVTLEKTPDKMNTIKKVWVTVEV